MIRWRSGSRFTNGFVLIFITVLVWNCEKQRSAAAGLSWELIVWQRSAVRCFYLLVLPVTLFHNLFRPVDLGSQAASDEVDIFSHCRLRLGVKDKEGQRVTQAFLTSVGNYNINYTNYYLIIIWNKNINSSNVILRWLTLCETSSLTKKMWKLWLPAGFCSGS